MPIIVLEKLVSAARMFAAGYEFNVNAVYDTSVDLAEDWDS